MHPFLNVGKLTDEQIIERIGRANSYLNMQSSLGHTPTIHSIEEVINSLEEERSLRLRRNTNAEFNRVHPDNLAPIEIGKIEDVNKDSK